MRRTVLRVVGVVLAAGLCALAYVWAVPPIGAPYSGAHSDVIYGAFPSLRHMRVARAPSSIGAMVDKWPAGIDWSVPVTFTSMQSNEQVAQALWKDALARHGTEKRNNPSPTFFVEVPGVGRVGATVVVEKSVPKEYDCRRGLERALVYVVATGGSRRGR